MKKVALYKDWRDAYKNAKRELRQQTRKIMLNNMVADNLADLIPEGKWELKSYGWTWLRYHAKEGTTVADLDKLAAKLAKALGREPSKSVGTEYVVFSFFMYPNMGNKLGDWPTLSIDLQVGNTEKCDFVETVVTEKRLEPTGYCKALKERMYLQKPQPVDAN